MQPNKKILAFVLHLLLYLTKKTETTVMVVSVFRNEYKYDSLIFY